jgi:hypothetical protein
MELSHSRDAASCVSSQEIPSVLWNPKVHYRVNKSSSLIPILSQINPVHTLYLFRHEIHLNTTSVHKVPGLFRDRV